MLHKVVGGRKVGVLLAGVWGSRSVGLGSRMLQIRKQRTQAVVLLLLLLEQLQEGRRWGV